MIPPAAADETRIRIMLVTPDGLGATIGTMRASDGAQGVRLIPLLKSLAPGPHAAMIHANGSCEPAEINGTKIAAGAAGDAFATTKSERSGEAAGKPSPRLRPFVLSVDNDGIARVATTILEVKLEMIKGRTIVIEDGAASEGGRHVACGVIP
jgi:superoxide dismutase, Cu-Zn family